MTDLDVKLTRAHLTADEQDRIDKVGSNREFSVRRQHWSEVKNGRTIVGKKLYKFSPQDYDKMTIFVQSDDHGKSLLCNAEGVPLNFDKSHLPEEEYPAFVIIIDEDSGKEKMLLHKHRYVMSSTGEEFIHHTNIAGLGHAVKYAGSIKKITNGRIEKAEDINLRSGHFRLPDHQKLDVPSMRGFLLEKFKDLIDEDITDTLESHNELVEKQWQKLTRGRSREITNNHRAILRTDTYDRSLPIDEDSDDDSIDLT